MYLMCHVPLNTLCPINVHVYLMQPTLFAELY